MTDVDSICVVIGRTRHGMLVHEIAEAAKQGAKLIEVRLDFLKKAPDFKRLLGNKPCPMLATVRRPPDGGKWAGSEDERRILLRQAIVAGFDWVDLETDAPAPYPGSAGLLALARLAGPDQQAGSRHPLPREIAEATDYYSTVLILLSALAAMAANASGQDAARSWPFSLM